MRNYLSDTDHKNITYNIKYHCDGCGVTDKLKEYYKGNIHSCEKCKEHVKEDSERVANIIIKNNGDPNELVLYHIQEVIPTFCWDKAESVLDNENKKNPFNFIINNNIYQDKPIKDMIRKSMINWLTLTLWRKE